VDSRIGWCGTDARTKATTVIPGICQEAKSLNYNSHRVVDASLKNVYIKRNNCSGISMNK